MSSKNKPKLTALGVNNETDLQNLRRIGSKSRKEGSLLEAAKNWADAKRHTAVQKNIEYCQHRIDFCERHHFRLKSMGEIYEKTPTSRNV